MATISVQNITKENLKILKVHYNATSYDDLLTRILDKHQTRENEVRKMFGSLKGKIGPWTKEDRMKSKYE